MLFPDRKVAAAFIEHYLSGRKEAWQIEVFDLNHLPTHSNIANKVHTCVDILNKLFATTQATDKKNAWLHVIYALYQAEVYEKSGWMPYLRSNFLLADLNALRSYLVFEMRDEIAKERAALLTANLPRTEITEKLLALQYEATHHLFYKDHILINDPLAKKLNEFAFEDFAKNLKDNKRELTLCNDLMMQSEALQTPSDLTALPVEDEKDAPKEMPPAKALEEEAEKTPSPPVARPVAKKMEEETPSEPSALQAHSLLAAAKKESRQKSAGSPPRSERRRQQRATARSHTPG